MENRKLSIRDEPNIRLIRSRNVKNTCFTDETRLRVYVQNVSVCAGTTRTHVSTCVRVVCRYTRARFERTHGDVFSGHTGFSACHAHTIRPQHHTETETETDRQTDRQRQRKKTDRERREDGRGETRERDKKTRQDKRREKIYFQCGGAWPFFVGVVIFWLLPVARETCAC